MASWVRSGAYHLAEWECPPPSADLGQPGGHPARQQRRHPGLPLVREGERPAPRLQPPRRRHRDRGDASPTATGSWREGGSSVGNLFTGDAHRSAFVMSRMGDPMSQLDVDAFSLYFMDPAAFIRTLVLSIGEFLKELSRRAASASRTSSRASTAAGPSPSCARPRTSSCATSTRPSWCAPCRSARPVIYTDLTDYDEIAHHAGPERIESLRALTGVDRVVAALERAAELRPARLPLRAALGPRPEPGRHLPAALRAVARGAHPGPHGRPGRRSWRPPAAARRSGP